MSLKNHAVKRVLIGDSWFSCLRINRDIYMWPLIQRGGTSTQETYTHHPYGSALKGSQGIIRTSIRGSPSQGGGPITKFMTLFGIDCGLPNKEGIARGAQRLCYDQ